MEVASVITSIRQDFINHHEKKHQCQYAERQRQGLTCVVLKSKRSHQRKTDTVIFQRNHKCLLTQFDSMLRLPIRIFLRLFHVPARPCELYHFPSGWFQATCFDCCGVFEETTSTELWLTRCSATKETAVPPTSFVRHG